MPKSRYHSLAERQQQKLLPVEYIMVTFTLPFELRSLAWSHQKMLYTLLFECAVSTLKDFGMNEKMLQGDLGMTAVLHTHTRRLDFHPHLHVVIPGGCIQRKRKQWKKLKGQYLFNEFALASVFRGRFLAAMNKAGMTPLKPHQNGLLIVNMWAEDYLRCNISLAISTEG
jgi:hypothetical protein